MKKQTMIITPNPSDIEVQTLTEELNKRGYKIDHFVPGEYMVDIFEFSNRFESLDPKKALVRGIGASATQKIFFRLDILTAIEGLGIRLINSRESLEIASDKLLTSIFLKNQGIPTPETIVCENSYDALKAFDKLGGDIVLKPLYGSKGIGVTRLNDKAFAENVIYALDELNIVFYLQKFIEHFHRDIRVFVLGNKAIAGMYRTSDNWKTNISAGGKEKPIELTPELKDLAISAAKAVKTEIAGVDIIESKDEGLQVIEVNSIPGFKALQRVSDINLAEKIIDYFLEN
ncbi:MAG: RimK family alpha-L-glutamate ligase [Promethearchaeota archaeon]|nr:MAG: RimK family alpha-L-glutamate ligase [Candidatus Lokiarchaeota archaeon]